MDGLESAQGVLVLGATNRPCTIGAHGCCTWLSAYTYCIHIPTTTGALDAALLRPGRFDVQLYVPPPDQAGRVEILQLACVRVPLGADVQLDAVAEQAQYFTGAELKALVREAAFLALREDVKVGVGGGCIGRGGCANKKFVNQRIVLNILSTGCQRSACTSFCCSIGKHAAVCVARRAAAVHGMDAAARDEKVLTWFLYHYISLYLFIPYSIPCRESR